MLYLSSFYRRSQLALRIGLFYTAASLSGAFGGLLARGLAEIGPRGNLEGWRWILIIEGLMVGLTSGSTKVSSLTDEQTVVCGVLSYFGLPNSPKTASFLTAEERKVIDEWLLSDNPCAPGYVPCKLVHSTCDADSVGPTTTMPLNGPKCAEESWTSKCGCQHWLTFPSWLDCTLSGCLYVSDLPSSPSRK